MRLSHSKAAFWLFFAFTVCLNVPATAARYQPAPAAAATSKVSTQTSSGTAQGYEDGPYGPSGKNWYADDRHDEDDESYSRQHQYGKDEPYGRQPGYDYDKRDPDGPEYEGPRHYERREKQITPICLQRTALAEDTETNITEETFRCCQQADDADSCANNSTSPYSKSQRRSWRHDEDNSFMNVLTTEPAATCKIQPLTDKTCPGFVADTSCRVLQLNCTLTRAASDCGCPIKDGSLYFSTIIYERTVAALACLKSRDDTSEMPYEAHLSYSQGHLETYATREGWKECVGSVEYVDDIAGNDQSAPTPASEPFTDLTWLRTGQMIVRLVQEDDY